MSNFVNLFDIIYPVGSVYITFNETSPTDVVGGTWELLNNTFLYSSADATGTTGGEKAHLLTIDEMPNHQHGIFHPIVVPWTNYIHTVWNHMQGTASGQDVYGEADANVVKTALVGGSKTHNNMPPYTTVHMYRRTA